MQARDIPPHLHERYGIRPPSPWRWLAWALAAVVVVPVLGYAATRYVATQSTTHSLARWGYSAQQVTVTLRTDPATVILWCAVRAANFDRVDVGFAVVPVAAGRSITTASIAVLERPLAVDLLACERDPYALPGPRFAPGVLPPEQRPPVLAPGVYEPSALRALQ